MSQTYGLLLLKQHSPRKKRVCTLHAPSQPQMFGSRFVSPHTGAFASMHPGSDLGEFQSFPAHPRGCNFDLLVKNFWIRLVGSSTAPFAVSWGFAEIRLYTEFLTYTSTARHGGGGSSVRR